MTTHKAILKCERKNKICNIWNLKAHGFLPNSGYCIYPPATFVQQPRYINIGNYVPDISQTEEGQNLKKHHWRFIRG